MTDEKIRGNLVFLKPISLKDKKQIIEWDKDPEVSSYREIYKTGCKKLSHLSFGVHDQKSLKLIGDIGIDRIDFKNKHAEIGMTIGDKNYWNQGFGTDLVKTILKFCFTKLNLNKVYLDVWEENKRAINCYTKCGFKLDGILRDHVYLKGKYHNKLIMSILKKDWVTVIQK